MAPHEHTVTEKHREMFAEMLKEGTDPISFWCDVLSDESAPMWARKEAATELKAYYHHRLVGMGPLIEQFGKQE
jgi:hypothetical protein